MAEKVGPRKGKPLGIPFSAFPGSPGPRGAGADSDPSRRQLWPLPKSGRCGSAPQTCSVRPWPPVLQPPGWGACEHVTRSADRAARV